MTEPAAADKALQEAGRALLTSLHALARVLVLYDANNAAVGRVLEGLAPSLDAFFQAGADALRLQLLSDEFFANGRLLRVDAQLYARGKEVAAALEQIGIGELRLQPSWREGAARFTADLGACLRGTARQMTGGSVGIETGRVARATSAAALRFEPDRLAIWLYASLLDAAEQLYADHQAGRTPSLRPIRRVLQLIIDGMATNSGIYQMLSVVREPGPLRAPARAAMCVDAIGFGRYVQLGSNDLMTLALCGLLGGLADTDDPSEAIRPLVSYSGLGDAAMPLVLTLHDARAARAGQPAGVPGRMLAVVEAYQELIARPRAPMPLAAALQAMSAGKIPHVEASVAKVFALYKGTFPIGSVVQLADKRVGIVLSQGRTEASKARPVIGLIGADRKLAGRLDLRRDSAARISRVITPQQARIRLAEL